MLHEILISGVCGFREHKQLQLQLHAFLPLETCYDVALNILQLIIFFLNTDFIIGIKQAYINSLF